MNYVIRDHETDHETDAELPLGGKARALAALRDADLPIPNALLDLAFMSR